MTMRLNWRDTVGIHLPAKYDDCVSYYDGITNAVGDDEQAFKRVGLITLILGNHMVSFSWDIYNWHWG